MAATLSQSTADTEELAANLARELFQKRSEGVFLDLRGDLGAGKSVFARGFIRQWLELAGESVETIKQSLVSPTYNLVKIYGKNLPIAHLDLYRLESVEELEQIGYEQYFYETPACIVEWMTKLPSFSRLRPPTAVIIEIRFIPGEAESREIEIARVQ